MRFTSTPDRTGDHKRYRRTAVVAVATLGAALIAPTTAALGSGGGEEGGAWEFVRGLGSGAVGGRDVAVGDDGVVHVAGDLEDGVFVGRYDAAGKLLGLQATDPSGWANANSIAVGDDGTVIIAGEAEGAVTFGEGSDEVTLRKRSEGEFLFVARYDPDGEFAWAYGVKHPVQREDPYSFGKGVAVDGAGRAYVAGSFSGEVVVGEETFTSDDGDAIVFALDNNGEVVWADQAKSQAGSASGDIAIGADGDLRLVGSHRGDTTFGTGEQAIEVSGRGGGERHLRYSDAFLVRYSADGTPVWARSTDSDDGVRATDVDVAQDGQAVMGGMARPDGTVSFGDGVTVEEAGADRAFVAAYGSDGQARWAQPLDPDHGHVASTPDRTALGGLAIDSHGHVRVAGSWFADMRTPDAKSTMFLRTYTSDGELIQDHAGPNRPSRGGISAVAVDPQDKTVVVGSGGDWDFSFGPGAFKTTGSFLGRFGDPVQVEPFSYGRADDQPLVGDWNGDGTDTIGVRRGRRWHLRNSNDGGAAEISFAYGRAGDEPVVGDWNGDGTDTVGVRRGRDWHLRNSNDGGAAEISFAYGRAGDEPVVGDWNGDGTETVGVRRGRDWHLRNSNNGGAADTSFVYGTQDDHAFGAGDWTGDGADDVGIARGHVWYLRMTATSREVSPDPLGMSYGRAQDRKVVGDWDGDGIDTAAVVRGGTWFQLDAHP